MNTPSDPPANETPAPAAELEYGEEVLCAGWNPDVEQLAEARKRQVEAPGEPPKRR